MTGNTLCFLNTTTDSKLAQTQLALDLSNFEQYELAYKILKPLAISGYTEGQYQFGKLLLAYPIKNNKYYDREKGLDWITKAAEKGDAYYQHNLAMSYASGPGFADDVKGALKSAFNWHKKAAEQGYAASQLKVGESYMNGRVVERDVVKAYMWFELSNTRFQHSINDPNELPAVFFQSDLIADDYISEAQIKKAIKLAAEWEKKHPRAYKTWPIERQKLTTK